MTLETGLTMAGSSNFKRFVFINFTSVQILLDIVQCGGVIGGPYIESNTNPIEVIFCNPDLIWKSEFPQPRLGQGAFREAFQAVYKVCEGQFHAQAS